MLVGLDDHAESGNVDLPAPGWTETGRLSQCAGPSDRAMTADLWTVVSAS
jgi:hypothetical protein